MDILKKFFHYLFIPSEKNNLRAKVLHNDFLTFYLVLAFLFVFAIRNFSTQLTDILGFATDITANKLYELTNEQRLKNNLSALSYSDKLALAAYGKAQDMFGKNYWAHFSPDGNTPWAFILSSGYRYEYAGENLAKNFLFSNSVVDAWMNSSTHRENLLRREFTDVGFAVVNGVLNGEETTLVVQMLGKPSGPQISAVSEEKPVLVKTAKASESVVSNQAKQKPQVNLTKVSFNFTYLFIVFLLIALGIDFYFASKLNILRLHGKNIAHLIFLTSIFLGLFLFFSKGAIL